MFLCLLHKELYIHINIAAEFVNVFLHVVYSGLSKVNFMIYLVRNQQVMMDSDLAMLYQVETRVLNQAATRNISRFPERFRFQLTKEEYENLISQIAISNSDRFENLKSQFVISSLGNTDSAHGGRRKLP